MSTHMCHWELTSANSSMHLYVMNKIAVSFK